MSRLRICHVASEVTPFAKTGGLADVTSALARFLAKDGHDVRVFMPMYGRVRAGAWDFEPVPRLQDIPLRLGERTFHVSISTTPLPQSSCEVYFVRCPELFGGPELYASGAEEALRFALLSRAALDCCQWLQWSPHVVHCHDWHAALIPLYLRTQYAWDRLFEATRTALTIHNIGYQGVFSSEILGQLGLADAREQLYGDDLDEGSISFLKTGILYAGALTTVSETYASEIQTPELGMGLDDLLRQRADHLVGIVNGVDYAEWDPRTDARIPHHFSARDLTGKAANKRALLERLGLPQGDEAPVLGMVSRLTFQKGFELLPDCLPVVLQREDVRLCVLGSGEEKYERYFEWLQHTYPEKVAYHNGYDDALAHLIEAGSDLFLMPSRYEPCGLNQMYSLRYGTVPLVRKTGGLADTVERYDPEKRTGTGFVFDEFTAHALLATLEHALEVYGHPDHWDGLVRRGMERDFSWEVQGPKYVELYRRLVRGDY